MAARLERLPMRKQFTSLAFALLVSFLGMQSHAARDSIGGHWEGTVTRERKEWRIRLDIDADKNGLKATIDAPDYGLYALPLTQVKTTDSEVHLERVDRSGKVTFDGNLEGDRMTGQWEGLGVSASFQLKRLQMQPVTFIEEEIRFQSGGATLVGTLVKPNGPGRFPAIVFTHGSGNQTRTEDFYRSRAYLYARHGIAALIYDRRGKGASTSGGEDISFPVLADDALAGVRVLKLRADINPRQIGVSGYSQGGWVSPLAAIRSRDVAFVIVGSAPGITPDEQNTFAVENELRAKKVPETSIAAVLGLRRRVSEFQYRGTGNKSELESEINRLRGESWFRNTLLPDGALEPHGQGEKEFLSFDPVPVWAKVRVPVLSMWGELDLLVPAETSRAILARALRKGGNRDYTLKIFPGASHGLSVIRGLDEPWDWPRLAPGYQELMVEWLLKRVDEADHTNKARSRSKRA
jgi:pimeloyl-ACP methyl ester carboxylesterase